MDVATARRETFGLYTKLFGAGLLIHATTLLNPSLLWDEWEWLWLISEEGVGSVWSLFVDAAHPGYTLTHGLIFMMGGNSAVVLGKAISILSLVGSAVFFFRILRAIPDLRRIAAPAAFLLIASPLFYTRGLMVHGLTYDFFALLVLLSIYMMRSRSRLFRGTSYVSLGVGLAYEVLIVLEPLRFFWAYYVFGGLRKAILHCLPYWAIVVAIAAGRLFAYPPSGIWDTYNEIQRDPVELIRDTANAVVYIFESSVFSVEQAINLTSLHFFIIIIVIILSISCISERNRFLASVPHLKIAGSGSICVVFGSFLLAVGYFPFLVSQNVPEIYQFNSRFFYPAQFGLVILITGAIAALPWRFLRQSLMTIVISVAGLCSVEVYRQFLLDSVVQRDVFLQAARLLDRPFDSELPLIRLSFRPSSAELTALRRQFSRDLSIVQNLTRPKDQSPVLIYDGSRHRTSAIPENYCRVSFVHERPCPSGFADWEYRLDLEFIEMRRVPFWTLVELAITRTAQAPLIGTLHVSAEWGTEFPDAADRALDQSDAPLPRYAPEVRSFLGTQ